VWTTVTQTDTHAGQQNNIALRCSVGPEVCNHIFIVLGMHVAPPGPRVGFSYVPKYVTSYVAHLRHPWAANR
jgi:hypothetical protein